MNKLVVSAFVLLPVAALAQKPFTVKGYIPSLKTGDVIYFSNVQKGQRVVDSAIAKNGSFELKGTVRSPYMVDVAINVHPDSRVNSRDTDNSSMYIEPGTIVLTSASDLRSATITGAPVNEDNNRLNAMLNPYRDKMMKLTSEFATYTPEQRNKAMQDAGRNLAGEMNAVYLEFAKNNPNSYLAISCLQRVVSNDQFAGEAEKAFTNLNNKLKTTEAGQSLKLLIEAGKKTAIGAIALDFTQNDPDGKPVTLSNFRGKYVLVDFWASWCVPCRTENPNLVAAFNKFKDKNFTVLGVSLDKPTGKAAWQKAIADDKLTWTHVSDLKWWDNEVAKVWGIRSVPSNFLIDPAGKIVARNIKGMDLQIKLEELLVGKHK